LSSITRASANAVSDNVAEVKNLIPCRRYMSLSPGTGLAMVSVLPTSLPPGFSVIHWPDVQNLAGSFDV
jgi:hypothetical protein